MSDERTDLQWNPKELVLEVSETGAGWRRVVYLGPVAIKIADYKEYSVELGGRPYMQVAGLINMWRDAHGAAAKALGRPVPYSVDVDIVKTGVDDIDRRYVTAKAVVMSELVGGPFVGYASSVVLTEAERKEESRRRRLKAEESNPIETACTSAIGRALRAAGLDLGATYEEMVEAMRRQPVEQQEATAGQQKTEEAVSDNERLMHISIMVNSAMQDPDFAEQFVRAIQERGMAKLPDDQIKEAMLLSALKYAARAVSDNNEDFVEKFMAHFSKHTEQVDGKDMAGIKEIAAEAWRRYQEKMQNAEGTAAEGNS